MSALLRGVLHVVLRLYRWMLSPLARLLGAECRFYPCCSAYAECVVASESPARALWLIAARVARCHPWHPGGVDFPPQHRSPPRQSGEAELRTSS